MRINIHAYADHQSHTQGVTQYPNQLHHTRKDPESTEKAIYKMAHALRSIYDVLGDATPSIDVPKAQLRPRPHNTILKCMNVDDFVWLLNPRQETHVKVRNFSYYA